MAVPQEGRAIDVAAGSTATVAHAEVMALANRRHIPQRKCVACGQKLAKRELIRIVRTPEGAVVVDRTGKSPGRGAYLCKSSLCWQRGVQKTSLERSLDITLSPQDRTELLTFYRETVAAPPAVER